MSVIQKLFLSLLFKKKTIYRINKYVSFDKYIFYDSNSTGNQEMNLIFCHIFKKRHLKNKIITMFQTIHDFRVTFF